MLYFCAPAVVSAGCRELLGSHSSPLPQQQRMHDCGRVTQNLDMGWWKEDPR